MVDMKRRGLLFIALIFFLSIFYINSFEKLLFAMSDDYLIELGEDFLGQCRLDEAEVEFKKALIVNSDNQAAQYYLEQIAEERARKITLYSQKGPVDSVCLCENIHFSFQAPCSDCGNCIRCTYIWDFGDGTTYKAGAEVDHQYCVGGLYTVTVTVDDNRGAFTTGVSDSVQIKVNNPPIAVTGCDMKGCVGELMFFDGSQSIDANYDSLTYTWDFGDGTSDEGIVATHAYSKGGEYCVTLTVDDNSGSSCSSSVATLNVTIGEKPVAIIEISEE
jgi:chitodextrinase